MDLKTARIFDANINRLLEGLRVVEDIFRFGFNDKINALAHKELRAKAVKGLILTGISMSDLHGSRDSKYDPGRRLHTASEAVRDDLAGIAASNFGRCKEALRVLEEFSKLSSPEAGKVFKDIRYDVYESEKSLTELLSTYSRKNKLDFDLYVVTDPDVLGKRSPITAVKEAIKGGAKIIQLRDKKAKIGQYYEFARQIAPICRKAGVSFIVNDYADICVEVDADGLHLGQDDVPVAVARKIIGNNRIIGLSTHSKEQALKGAASGADYISIGPVFATQSKPNTAPVGIELVKFAAKNIRIPFVAIGGINENTLPLVLKAGAKRAAVIRAGIGGTDITKAVKRLRRSFNAK